MSVDKDGGPVHPSYVGYHGACVEGERCRISNGISIRDYFAARAMQAIVSSKAASQAVCDDSRYPEMKFGELVAENAYDFADAMVKARNK